MQTRLDMIEKWLVRIVCALALVFVGFAHQVPAIAAEPVNPAEYVLPDGTLPTLCVTVADDEGKTSTDHKLHNHGCEACRISASVLLPSPADIAGITVAFSVRVELPFRVEALHRQIYPPNTGPRAPPSNPILT
ncbi:hypothetical protein EFQ99_24725 [Rhizobium vallis]|uniref:DUF2946 domain-containing protein n=1 Tax=Rhizobium vallis TaxID=634290 RepID=A0A432PF90_9HYPH|nr:DUF2946 family protein [Rhizobium vallis]RUM22322.1 hypothetical protein EFQ99_24725 [Rhizobium vallis]